MFKFQGYLVEAKLDQNKRDNATRILLFDPDFGIKLELIKLVGTFFYLFRHGKIDSKGMKSLLMYVERREKMQYVKEFGITFTDLIKSLAFQ